jgi:hypothetical protein
MKKARQMALLLTVFATLQTVDAQTTAGTVTVSLSSFGTAGLGGDDTSVIQSAIDVTAENGYRLEIPASPVPYNVQPLTVPTGANVLLDAGVTMEATSGYGMNDRMINLEGATNVTIVGTIGLSEFQMQKPEYTSGEYRHCLFIDNSSNVQITGIACNDSGGDGLYISGTSSNITIEDSIFDNNLRQGFSLISGNGIYVRRCQFTNTNGTLPQDGIDIEPNSATDSLVNVHIEDSYSQGNFGNGVAIDTRNLNWSSSPVSVSILRHHTKSNAQSGYFATNELSNSNGVSGTIVVSESSSTLDQQYGAVASFYDAAGATLIFQDLTVADSNQSGTNYDDAAVAVKRGGGGFGPEGNVYFLGTSIIDTTGKLQCYFTLRDYSNVGYVSVQFMNSIQLIGVPWNQPIALIDGFSTSAVNIP